MYQVLRRICTLANIAEKMRRWMGMNNGASDDSNLIDRDIDRHAAASVPSFTVIDLSTIA
jgi:hypothetical protein